MASFDNLDRSKESSVSPRSSIGSGEPLDATPASTVTAFSPEVVKYSDASLSASKVGNTAVMESLADPFVVPPTLPKLEVKLSATASEFQPLSLIVGNFNASGPRNIKLGEDQNEHAVGPKDTGFAPDDKVARCLKITDTTNGNVVELVDASLTVSYQTLWHLVATLI